jgi:uncharacterized membrane protein YfcA
MALEIIKQNFIILFIASFCLGLDKGGLKLLLVVCMYFLTKIVPSKDMLSILAPIMFIGDIIPIYIYRKDVNKKAVFSFLPYVIIGIILAGFLSKNLDDSNFTVILALFILMMAVMMSVSQYKNSKKTDEQLNEIKRPLSPAVKTVLGFITGVSSISNSAAAITNMYFFRETKTRQEFIGSSSAFFFFVNALKLIVIAFLWRTINAQTLLLAAAMIPGALVGIFVATKLIKVMPEILFKIIILISVYYVAVMLLIKNFM